METHLGGGRLQFQSGVYRGTRTSIEWFGDHNHSYAVFPSWRETASWGWEGGTRGYLAIWVGCDLLCNLVLDTVLLPWDGLVVWLEAPPAPEPRLEDSETYQKPLEEK